MPMVMVVAIVLVVMIMAQQGEALKKKEAQETTQQSGCYRMDVHPSDVNTLWQQV